MFLEKVTLYGEVAIKSRYLEAKPLKFSPPKSLCGTVGSPWVSLATLFGFWETLINFSESMILYGEKKKKIGALPLGNELTAEQLLTL